MITFDFTQAYPSFAAILFFVTGCMLLFGDVKMYQARNMIREKMWARRLGWTNLSLAALLFLARWIYLQWIW